MNAVFEEDSDYKSRLLIWAQRHRHKVVFTHVSEPDKERDLFRAFVEIDGALVAQAVSSSVKSAEQRAAELAFAALDQENLS